jgi:hypothetical protein
MEHHVDAQNGMNVDIILENRPGTRWLLLGVLDSGSTARHTEHLMRPPHLIVALVTLALVSCGDATARESPATETPPPPAHDAAIVIPEADDGRVAAGTIVEVIYPGGEGRGRRHFLQRWDGQTWSDVYQVSISDPGEPYDEERIENAWAPADEEFPLTDDAFGGSEGGQFTVIPAPAKPPGTYRICGAQKDPLCSAAFEVTLATPATSATDEASDPLDETSQPVDEAGEPANDPAEDPAVVSLMDDFGISASQAISQMEAQVAAGRAVDDLPPGLERVFSDIKIEHEQGGRVVVAMTDRRLADAMGEHFASYGVSDIEIRIVRYTNRQLDATAEEMQRRLINAHSPQNDINVSVGRGSLGKVTVEFVEGPMNATEEEILAEARADSDMFAVTEVDHIDAGEED